MKNPFRGSKKSAPPPRLQKPVQTIDEDETIVINLLENQPEPKLHIQAREAPARPTPEKRTRSVPTKPRRAPAADETIVFGSPAEAARPPATAVLGNATAAAWLCIRTGGRSGLVFPVPLGRNRIGRGAENQIRIDIGDSTISKFNHASIVADPKTKTFHILPGDATNLAYLNDQPVLQPQPVKDRDKVQIGSTEFVFVQYFGNYVDWA